MRKKIEKRTPEQEREAAFEKAALKLRGIIEGGDLQNFFTPVSLFDECLSKVDISKKKRALVLYNLEAVLSLVKNNFKGEIIFFTQSPEKAEEIEKLNREIGYNIKVEYISISHQNPLNYLEMKFPKYFDLVISNPPYGSGNDQHLHLYFLDLCLDICKGEIVFIHPSNQFILPPEVSNTTAKNLNNKIEPYLKSITLFNGIPVFGEKVYNKHIPVSITHLDLNKEGDTFRVINEITDTEEDLTSISDINIFNEYECFNSIKEKIKSKMAEDNIPSVQSMVKTRRKKGEMGNPSGSHFIRIEVLTGSTFKDSRKKLWKDDFFTIVGKNRTVCPILPKDQMSTHWLEYSTEVRAENHLHLFKQPIVRFCLATMKTDKNLMYKLWNVPYMDPDKRFTNSELCKYFGITQKEQKFVNKIIKEIYV